ncbi:Crp/Fnr family transcriptional regulator [Luteimonas terrae]|uniref:CRP-like protein Clp n=1 Tax=Luteimonas terrae TaxID=1530191 RepID=A0ABU1XY91_9GAMM|nr:Crp/Fnr family transcriptional regulator [Luteimonas terrae]MDR7193739.1 CRP-like cAMP-binding protein [Luteimonas terrae]
MAGNHLLGQIAALVGPPLIAQVERVECKAGQVLHEPDDVMSYVYFPIDCLVSLLHVMESGDFAETALVGNDGVVGVALVMGGESMPLRAHVHIGGSLCRLRSQVLRQCLADVPALQQVFLRYAQTLLTQMGQVAACNRHHSLDQQFSRRLLMSLDRLPREDLRMTHESVAQMLGVRRESVTLAANKLQKAGAIRYSRGLIQVLDRDGLEDLTCECYAVVGRELRRLSRQPVASGTVGAFVGSRTDATATATHAADDPEAEVFAHAADSARDRRRGSDRRQLPAERRREGIAISFPDRRLAPSRRKPNPQS